jgi:tRNA (guanine37-N1)-methyltransferase
MTKGSTAVVDMNALFRAPLARGIKQLDKSLFTRILATSAASVSDNRLLSKYRKTLEKSGEILRIKPVSPVAPDPNPSVAAIGQKCLLLKPDVNRHSKLRHLPNFIGG